jgi:hypothetical protein
LQEELEVLSMEQLKEWLKEMSEPLPVELLKEE